MVFYINITSNVKVGESLCSDPRGLLQAPTCSFSFSNGGNGPPCPSLEKHLSLGNGGAMAQRENG